jgi:hypothetical protein
MGMSDNIILARAFPSELQDEARAAIACLPVDNSFLPMGFFELNVGKDLVSIPHRLYHDTSGLGTCRIPDKRRQLLECLLTRHSDGHIRQHYLERIVKLK